MLSTHIEKAGLATAIAFANNEYTAEGLQSLISASRTSSWNQLRVSSFRFTSQSRLQARVEVCNGSQFQRMFAAVEWTDRSATAMYRVVYMQFRTSFSNRAVKLKENVDNDEILMGKFIFQCMSRNNDSIVHNYQIYGIILAGRCY